VSNLDKPAGFELTRGNFKVPCELSPGVYKTYPAQNGMSMVDLLRTGV
jgi:hypothetical protein